MKKQENGEVFFKINNTNFAEEIMRFDSKTQVFNLGFLYL
jgi:hypothetical protein